MKVQSLSEIRLLWRHVGVALTFLSILPCLQSCKKICFDLDEHCCFNSENSPFKVWIQITISVQYRRTTKETLKIIGGGGWTFIYIFCIDVWDPVHGFKICSETCIRYSCKNDPHRPADCLTYQEGSFHNAIYVPGPKLSLMESISVSRMGLPYHCSLPFSSKRSFWRIGALQNCRRRMSQVCSRTDKNIPSISWNLLWDPCLNNCYTELMLCTHYALPIQGWQNCYTFYEGIMKTSSWRAGIST